MRQDTQNRNVTLLLPGSANFNPPADIDHRAKSNDHHAPDVQAKARLMDTISALLHKSHAVLIYFFGVCTGAALAVFMFIQILPLGADALERGAMIGSVFGENATQNAPGDPRGVQ